MNIPLAVAVATLTDYAARKEGGFQTPTKVGEEYFLVSKAFDPNTGAALPDKSQKINLDALRAEIARLQATLEAKQALLADLEKL